MFEIEIQIFRRNANTPDIFRYDVAIGSFLWYIDFKI